MRTRLRPIRTEVVQVVGQAPPPQNGCALIRTRDEAQFTQLQVVLKAIDRSGALNEEAGQKY